MLRRHNSSAGEAAKRGHDASLERNSSSVNKEDLRMLAFSIMSVAGWATILILLIQTENMPSFVADVWRAMIGG